MALVIGLVLVLFVVALVRFRDVPGNPSPYVPEWTTSRRLELLWMAIPLLIVAVIAVPTVRGTYALAHLPPTRDPVVIDVTSLNWKWLFQYPHEHIATVNYVNIPAGTPVLFELTANSPMNTFWVPQLGGMEYTMPGRILPLWLEAAHPGTYLGRSANFSGLEFAKMGFTVHALAPRQFALWARQVKERAPKMTRQEYSRLLRWSVVAPKTYSGYPQGTFPPMSHGFTLQGGMYHTPKYPTTAH